MSSLQYSEFNAIKSAVNHLSFGGGQQSATYYQESDFTPAVLGGALTGQISLADASALQAAHLTDTFEVFVNLEVSTLDAKTFPTNGAIIIYIAQVADAMPNTETTNPLAILDISTLNQLISLKDKDFINPQYQFKTTLKLNANTGFYVNAFWIGFNGDDGMTISVQIIGGTPITVGGIFTPPTPAPH